MWPVSFIPTSFNDAVTPEQRETSFRHIRSGTKRRKSVYSHPVTKIELYRLAPEDRFSVLLFIGGCLKDFWLLIPQSFAVEAEIQITASQEHSVDVGEVLLKFAYCPSDRHLEDIIQDNFRIVSLRTFRCLLDRQFGNIVTHYRGDVEGHGFCYGFTEC